MFLLALEARCSFLRVWGILSMGGMGFGVCFEGRCSAVLGGGCRGRGGISCRFIMLHNDVRDFCFIKFCICTGSLSQVFFKSLNNGFHNCSTF